MGIACHASDGPQTTSYPFKLVTDDMRLEPCNSVLHCPTGEEILVVHVFQPYPQGWVQ
ncbi:hypothetical protein K402DRAFT_393967 [Aulographum hederae CBS 113979]|uniref:Uncharacterized protein n=1 Tax=Aulographum hederae CBS 113979 TaxID=1176131 RepID=A0A6G1GZF5_9PEZI|nr:hypothetical protein K402DRAFT_393967 [Aulographum hederae CBS 113979]